MVIIDNQLIFFIRSAICSGDYFTFSIHNFLLSRQSLNSATFLTHPRGVQAEEFTKPNPTGPTLDNALVVKKWNKICILVLLWFCLHFYLTFGSTRTIVFETRPKWAQPNPNPTGPGCYISGGPHTSNPSLVYVTLMLNITSMTTRMKCKGDETFIITKKNSPSFRWVQWHRFTAQRIHHLLVLDRLHRTQRFRPFTKKRSFCLLLIKCLLNVSKFDNFFKEKKNFVLRY